LPGHPGSIKSSGRVINEYGIKKVGLAIAGLSALTLSGAVVVRAVHAGLRPGYNSIERKGGDMRSRISTCVTAMTLATALAIPVRLAAQDHQDGENARFITFDAPGAGTGSGQGTAPLAVNPARASTGLYIDASNVYHGFLRARNGTISTFDAPGAGTGSGQGTYAVSINSAGAITGADLDAGNVWHAFLRAPSGSITTFDVPGAGTGAFQGTQPAVTSGINPAGAITGWYIDASNVYHGFLRAPTGSITTFDVPGAGTGSGQGTLGQSINPAGVISGYSVDSANVYHGFLRARNGTISTFDAPGAGTGAFQGTFPSTINPAGVIVGDYYDAGNVDHGFLRAPDGTFTTFDAPGAGTGSFQGTRPLDINPAGVVTGFYVDASNVYHGFLRVPCEGDEDCEDNEGATATPEVNAAPDTQRSSTVAPSNPALSGRGMPDWLLSPYGQRYRIPGSGTGPKN
jgi:hypothetical protein